MAIDYQLKFAEDVAPSALAGWLRGDLVLTSRDDWWIRPTFAPGLADRLGAPYRLEPLPII